MKRILYALLIGLFSTGLSAQQTSLKFQVLQESNNEALHGATIVLKNTELWAITDDLGHAILEHVPLGSYDVEISHLGFETLNATIVVKEGMPIIIYYLHETGEDLDAVTISATRSTRTIKNIPTRVEFIGGEELGEKGLMNAANISMVLRESTGIQMQQTSLSSGNSTIRIQGLDGRYTQLLKDGFPLYGGFSGGLSMMQIPPLDLKQFEIVKGSSSTLYGGGAIAGLVNLVSKMPEENPVLDIMVTQTHAGGTTGNVFVSNRNQKTGYTLYVSGNRQRIYDADDNGFSNLPEISTITLNPKWFYYPSGSTTLWVGFNGTLDKREGGDIHAIEYGATGEDQFFEINKTKRMSSQIMLESRMSETEKLQIKNSFSYFDRKLTNSRLRFSGNQKSVFSEVNYSVTHKRSEWILGGNYYYNSFSEYENPLPRDQHDNTVGVFVNNITDLSNWFILESGFRTDLAKTWGLFPLPRLALLWKPSDVFSSRIGGGLGYKIPDMFTEEAQVLVYENILPIDKDALSAERSIGMNIDFNIDGELSDAVGVSFNQLFYLTRIKNALLLNSINDKFLFENAPAAIISRGLETNLKLSYQDFRMFLNYSFISTTLNYLEGNPQKPLTPKHMAGWVIMYENEDWRIGWESYYTGRQDLSSGGESNDYVTLGFLVQKHFKWGSPFMNFENFTDRRQSRFSPESLPPYRNPVQAEIYAPTDGFVFSVGVVFNVFGREEHHD
jgi:iron complex outermembrane receptor protein